MADASWRHHRHFHGLDHPQLYCKTVLPFLKPALISAAVIIIGLTLLGATDEVMKRRKESAAERATTFILSHVPIRWNRLIDKNMRQIRSLSMILSQKWFHFCGSCSKPSLPTSLSEANPLAFKKQGLCLHRAQIDHS